SLRARHLCHSRLVDFTHTATTEIYPLSLHDALPIWKRRSYSKRFKAELVAECLAGEDSIASIALRHDSNPNLVHRWVTENRRYGQHELSELSELKSKGNVTVTPSSWVAAVPLNSSPQKTYTPQAAQHKPPSTAGARSI